MTDQPLKSLPVLTLENVDALYKCASVEEIAQRVACGQKPSAHPQGVFRFRGHQPMNRTDELAEQRMTEFRDYQNSQL